MRQISVARMVASVFWITFGFLLLQLAYMRIFLLTDRSSKVIINDEEDTKADVFDFEKHFQICSKRSRLNTQSSDFIRIKKEAKTFLSDESVIERTKRGCDKYFENVPNFSDFDAKFEDDEEFFNDKTPPLAFSHQIHKQIGILEMFLALYYRPTNFHCIHLDTKANGVTREAAESLVECYQKKFPDYPDSIFFAENPVSVFWGHMSVLDADLICLRELRRRNKDWQHAATLAGTELPMVSYQTYKQTLSQLPPGESLYFSGPYPAALLSRIQEVHHLYWAGPGPQDLMIRTVGNGERKPPPPYRLQIFKGMKNIIIHRDFVDFVLDDPIAIEFKEWLEDTCCPEEAFYSTLGRLVVEEWNGKRKLIQDLGTEKLRGGVCPRYTIWWGKEKCHGKSVRGVCNFALNDLPTVHASSCLIANKFNLDVDSAAVMCQVHHIINLNARL